METSFRSLMPVQRYCPLLAAVSVVLTRECSAGAARAVGGRTFPTAHKTQYIPIYTDMCRLLPTVSTGEGKPCLLIWDGDLVSAELDRIGLRSTE